MNDKSKRGGHREGAGRPPMYDEAMIPMKVKVPPQYKSRIREIGDGNMSLGVRRLLEHHDQITPPNPDNQSDD